MLRLQRGYSCAIKHLYGLSDKEASTNAPTQKSDIAKIIEPDKEKYNITAITCEEPIVEGYLRELGFEAITQMPKCELYTTHSARKPLTLWLRKCPLPMWNDRGKKAKEAQKQADDPAIFDHWDVQRPGESKGDFEKRRMAVHITDRPGYPW